MPSRRFCLILILLLITPLSAQTERDIWGRIGLIQMAMDIGNPGVAKQCIEAMDPDQISDARLKEILLKAGVDPEIIPEFRVEMKIVKVGADEMAGLYSKVVEKGPALLPETKMDPGLELYLRLMLVQAGRRGAFPQVVDEQLPLAQKLTGKVEEAEADAALLARFILDTYQLERRLLVEPDLSNEEILKSAHSAWELWEQVPLGRDGLFYRQWSWAFDAVGVWREILWERYASLPEGNREREQIQAFLDQQVSDLNSRAGREQKVYLETHEINMAYLLSLGLETYRDSRRLHNIGESEAATLRLKDMWRYTPDRFFTKMTNQAISYGWDEEKTFTWGSEFHLFLSLYRLEQALTASPDKLLKELDRAQEQMKFTNNPSKDIEVLLLGLETMLEVKPAGWEQKADLWSEQALASSRRLNDRLGLIRSLIYRGELLGRQNRFEEAVTHLQQATDEIEAYVSEFGADSGRRVRSQFERAYELLTDYQMEAGQVQEAMTTALRSRQVEQLTTSQIQQSQPQEEELKEAVLAAREARASLRAREEESIASGRTLEATDEARANFYRSLETIREMNPRYADHLAVRPINFARLKSSLPTNAALVVIAPLEDRTYLFVLTDTLTVKVSQVGYDQLTELVTTMRHQINRLRPAAKESGTELYDHLIAPIEENIAGKEVLAFVPTRSLIYLPLPALAKTEGGEVEYLAERFQIVTILKDSDLDGLVQPAQLTDGKLYAFANPDGSLPSASEEAEGVGRLFQGEVFVGDEATEQKLGEIQRQAGILHFATHGVLNPIDPQASYLVMAGDGESARLTLDEVYGLDLSDVSLVTLSACETSLGRDNPGSEVSSLASAFSIAAAGSSRSPSVMATLWKVSDVATSELMKEFYAQLKTGLSKSAALQKAQRKLISDPSTSHPYFWAPFVLIGDWR